MASRPRRGSRAGVVAGKPDDGAAIPDGNDVDAGSGGSIADGEVGASDQPAVFTDTTTAEQPAVTAADLAEPGKRKRGRPPGSGAGKAKAIPINVSGLEKLLVGIHASLSFFIRPELALDTQPSPAFDGKSESAFLAQSIADVSRHYTSELIDQKTVDWLNLLQALGIVYGGRVFAIRMANKSRPAPAPRHDAPAPRNAAPQFHAGTPVPPNNMFSAEAVKPNGSGRADVGEIPGVGDVVLPPDHPLNPNQPKKLN